MRKIVRKALLAVLLTSSCVNFCYAEDAPTTIKGINEISKTNPIENISNLSGIKPEVPKVEPSKELTPILVAPVVQDPKVKKQAGSTKIDLKAILFDSNAKFNAKAIEENREMTKAEKAEYNLHEALHGSVSVPSTKGLLEDKMKMTFDKGPIESIAPWVDFNGAFSGIWTGDNYSNTLYGINFNDVGINCKIRTNDDPASGKKTLFRLMYNVGKEVAGNTYMQSFLADNYIMRYWSKDDQVMLGYARSAIGIEGGESPFTIPFFGRSQISRTYGNVRSLGVKAQGNHKLYDYSIGGFSSGRYFKDFFPGPEFTGLISINPLGMTDGKWGKITTGGSLNAGNAESHYRVVGAHVIYDYKRLKASFEYAAADGSNGSTGFTANKSEGYYGTLAYRISPKLQALVRYDKFDPNINKANDMRTEYTAGINYFIKEQALKLMLNYVYYTLENGGFGNRIMVGTQIIL